MANKLSSLVLGLLLIVPVFNALPVLDASSHEIFSKQLCGQLRILAFTHEEFDVMNLKATKMSPVVFKAVLKDPKVTEEKSEEMQKYIKLLSDYVEKSDKIEEWHKKDEALSMYIEFESIIKQFDGKNNKNPSPAALIVEKSLKENGVDDVEKTVLEYFEAFLKKFNTEVEEYFKGLNDEEKKEVKQFMEWFDKLQVEKDLEKKMQLFEKIVENSESEST